MQGEQSEPRPGRKLTRKERKELSPIQQEYIEKGGNWIWMDNEP